MLHELNDSLKKDGRANRRVRRPVHHSFSDGVSLGEGGTILELSGFLKVIQWFFLRKS